MIKLFNVWRTLDRMKKYDYMKQSQFYKNMRRFERKYRKADSREEKRKIKEQIESLIEQNPGQRNVNEFKKEVRKRIETVNRRYGQGETVITEENYADYINFISKVQTAFGDFFYGTENALEIFKDTVVIGGESVDKAVKTLAGF